MKQLLLTLTSSTAMLLLASCNSLAPAYSQGRGSDVENLERQAPVNDAPRVDTPHFGDPFNNYPYRDTSLNGRDGYRGHGGYGGGRYW